MGAQALEGRAYFKEFCAISGHDAHVCVCLNVCVCFRRATEVGVAYVQRMHAHHGQSGARSTTRNSTSGLLKVESSRTLIRPSTN